MVWNRDVEPYARERDRQVAKKLQADGKSTIICHDPSCSWLKDRLRDAVLKNQFQVCRGHILYNRNGVDKRKNFTNKHIGNLFRRFRGCRCLPVEISAQTTAIGNGYNGSVYIIIALSICNA